MASDSEPRERALALADLADRLTGEGVSARGSGDLGILVGGVTLDSRRVSPGDLYAALPARPGRSP